MALFTDLIKRQEIAMRRRFELFVILAVLPFLLAMGSLSGGASSEKIPSPEKKFTAIFIDQMDTIEECTGVSVEGETFLEGTKGKGIYTISFDEIKSVVFCLKCGKLNGSVELNDGSRIDLILKKDSRAYGKTKYGTFQIRLSNLKKMIIHPAFEE
jgi:hypothetical protein